MQNKQRFIGMFILFSTAGLGCGNQSSHEMSNYSSARLAESTSTEVAMADTDTASGGTTDVSANDDADHAIKRKIIYEAKMDLTVTSLDGIPEQLKSIIESAEGYLAHSNHDGTSGNHRRGVWKIKVPTSNYQEFLSQAEALGELQSVSENTTEVTAEFYDLDARVRTKQEEEQRMLLHLKEDTKELKDILAVEKELMRIRGELERLQGQLRLLTHRVDFSTITLTITEYTHYQPAESLGLIPEIQRAWGRSLAGVSQMLRNILILGVAFFPWAITLGVPATLLYFLVRRRKSRPLANKST